MFYVAFLRGINVGGRFVKMDALRAIFEAAGCSDVRTHIQSGNVFFTSRASVKTLTPKIQLALQKALGYEIAAFLFTLDELKQIMDHNPFAKLKLKPEVRPTVMFLSKPLPKGTKLPIVGKDFEIIGLQPRAAYTLTGATNGRVGNPAAFLEKTYKVKVTARWFHTTEKIYAAALAAARG